MRKIIAPLFGIIIICLLGATLTVPVSAATLSVGAGAQYRSITEAVNAAQSGDIVSLGPGTYAENVIINKPVTITASSPGSTTIVAADPSKDVFLVEGANVRIEGLIINGATGASGVHLDHASSCVVRGINAHGNDKAVYLDGATNCEVSSSNLDDNGYGVYCDSASHNTIQANSASGAKGGSKALGDGIYMWHSNDNTVAYNNLSINHVFGISLYYSDRNAINNNSILNNQDFGTRLGWSNNNTLTHNTYSNNANAGITPVETTGNQIYLNNFVNQKIPVGAPELQQLNSPEQLSYSFNSTTHIGYMGNYYSDYTGSDSNGTGIGSAPAGNGDKYPLIQPVDKYSDIGTPAPATTTTTTTAQPTNPASANVTAGATNTTARSLIPGFDAGEAFLAIGVAAFVFVFWRLRRD